MGIVCAIQKIWALGKQSNQEKHIVSTLRSIMAAKRLPCHKSVMKYFSMYLLLVLISNNRFVKRYVCDVSFFATTSFQGPISSILI